MNPATPKTKLPPSTHLRKAVFGGFPSFLILSPQDHFCHEARQRCSDFKGRSPGSALKGDGPSLFIGHGGPDGGGWSGGTADSSSA